MVSASTLDKDVRGKQASGGNVPGANPGFQLAEQLSAFNKNLLTIANKGLEVYASSDGKRKFVDDFVTAWDKVMMLDRFELEAQARENAARMASSR